MQLTSFLLLPLLGALGPAAAGGGPPTRPETTTVTLRIPPSHLLPSPHVLPAATRATLTTLGRALAAPLSAADTFVFRNVTPGSYLADVHCATHAFVPLRVDVLRPSSSSPAGDDDGGEGADAGGGAGAGLLRVAAWETYRGNDWGNKGEAAVVSAEGVRGGAVVDVRVAGEKGYFMERSKCRGFFFLFPLVLLLSLPDGTCASCSCSCSCSCCADRGNAVSVLSIFRNPIILLSMVSMALFFGMPKLVENSKFLSLRVWNVATADDCSQWTLRCVPSGRRGKRRAP